MQDIDEQLYLATMRQDSAAVRRLVKEGADVNAVSAIGWVPLRSALAGNISWQIIEMLLAVGADPQLARVEVPINLGGTTLLHEAVVTGRGDGQKRKIDWLLNHGADINAVQENGFTALCNAVILRESADLGIIRMLLSRGANANVGSPILHAGVSRSCWPVVEALLDAGADINAQDPHCETILHRAAYRGEKEMAARLIERGANIAIQNDHGNALHHAATGGSWPCIELLLANGSDVNARNSFGRTPVHMLAKDDLDKHIQRLYDRCAADLDVPDMYGLSALHHACSSGCTKATRTLVALGANPDLLGEFGRTPLHCAAKNGYGEAVRALIAAGADLSIRDAYGFTPSGLAREYGYEYLAATMEAMALERVLSTAAARPGAAPVAI